MTAASLPPPPVHPAADPALAGPFARLCELLIRAAVREAQLRDARPPARGR